MKTNTSLTLTEAAKMTGRSRSTIWKAMDKGELGDCKDERGKIAIEPACLFKVFPPIAEKTQNETTGEQIETPKKTEKTVSELLEMVADLRVKLAELDTARVLAEAERDAEKRVMAEMEKRILLLQHISGQTQTPTEGRRGFFSFFSRKATA